MKQTKPVNGDPVIGLQYASPEARYRRRRSAHDVIYLVLVVACYLMAGYAQLIMPGGYSWGFDWEFANFFMTIAALSSIVLFIAGAIDVLIVGRRRVAVIVLIGLWLSGALPILMWFVAKRWLQGNFA